MALYYVYILQSSINDSFYIGSTNDLVRSFNEHKAGEEIETRRLQPSTLVWYKAKPSRSAVLILEKKLKNFSVAQMIAFMRKNGSDTSLGGVTISPARHHPFV